MKPSLIGSRFGVGVMSVSIDFDHKDFTTKKHN